MYSLEKARWHSNAITILVDAFEALVARGFKKAEHTIGLLTKAAREKTLRFLCSGNVPSRFRTTHSYHILGRCAKHGLSLYQLDPSLRWERGNSVGEL